MKKTKVLFVHLQMNIGGVESALISALRLLDPEKYDIELMLLKAGGLMYDKIPSFVKVSTIPFKPIGAARSVKSWPKWVMHCFCVGHWGVGGKAIYRKVSWWFSGKKNNFWEWETEDRLDLVDTDRLPKSVDFAFNYMGGVFLSRFVFRYFGYAKTGVWFHNEGVRLDTRIYWNAVAPYTWRFGCSKSMSQMLNELYDARGMHFDTIPHCVDFAEYRRRAEAGATFADGYTGFRILTVARACRQKGTDYAIQAARQLKDLGLDFRWYWLGAGGEFREYPEQVTVEDVADRFVFLGETDNPYRYYQDCDLYVQPSRYEAYCLSVAEARAFNKPIVASDFVGAREQVRPGETGEIVPTDDVGALVSAIRRMMADGEVRCRYSANLSQEINTMVAEAKKAWDELLSKDGRHNGQGEGNLV